MDRVSQALESLTAHRARFYIEAIDEMVIAVAQRNRPALADARGRLEESVRATMGVAEIIGAQTALKHAAALGVRNGPGGETRAAFGGGKGRFHFASPAQTLLPRVSFEEAIEDMIERTPATLRSAAERTAQRIAEFYERGGTRSFVAFARSAEAAVTERVQAMIAEALREGTSETIAGREISMGVDEIRRRTSAWTEGYSRMVFRTNVNTAVTAGRFRQVQDPAVKEIIPAFRFDAVGDADTRRNHDAADGVIMRVDNPAWNRIAPPLGYNCRCQVSFVGLPELRGLGRVGSDGGVLESRLPADAGPDAGFTHSGRPDVFFPGG